MVFIMKARGVSPGLPKRRIILSEILKKIKRQIVDPAVKDIRNSAYGYVTEVDFQSKTCNVILIEKDGTRRRKNNLSFDTGRGLQNQSLKPGDTVEVGYRNNNFKHSYIIRIHEQNAPDIRTTKGQDLPGFTNLF